jgi:hypothetical protein
MFKLKTTRAIAWMSALIGLMSCVAAGAAGPDASHAEATAMVHDVEANHIKDLDDAQLVARFQRLAESDLVAYLEAGTAKLNEYELWMSREERLNGQPIQKPFINYIKYRHSPRQIYVKWLPESAKAGQEIIYDELKRRDAMLGHIGGAFNLMSTWIALDGSMARSNSVHSIRDIGLQGAIEHIAEATRYRLAHNGPKQTAAVSVVRFNGERVVMLVWVAPAGDKASYAHRTAIYLDLQRPLIRKIESWDDQDELLERIVFTKVTPARFSDLDFDPKNPAYSF